MPDERRAADRVSTAVVMADGLETKYRRCGAGPTVVALGVEGVVDALARSFRVIAPEPPPALAVPPETAEAGWAGWLRGVFDGLGITAAVIVAAPTLADAAMRFAGDEPDRVKGVVMPAGNPADLSGAVARFFS